MNAASGTIVSCVVLTAAAEDALPLPVVARALFAAFRAELLAIAAAFAAAVVGFAVFGVATVPTTALETCVPLAFPPDVLT
ncbi:MAG TPA: hypothetical protein VKB76_15165 [Ktedonobacterales bacterium]|nr:hypothetical protein [Ktedonobacterales bacterium]